MQWRVSIMNLITDPDTAWVFIPVALLLFFLGLIIAGIFGVFDSELQKIDSDISESLLKEKLDVEMCQKIKILDSTLNSTSLKLHKTIDMMVVQCEINTILPDLEQSKSEKTHGKCIKCNGGFR